MVLVLYKAARTQSGKSQVYEFGGLEAKVKQANRTWMRHTGSVRMKCLISLSFINFDMKNDRGEERES